MLQDLDSSLAITVGRKPRPHSVDDVEELAEYARDVCALDRDSSVDDLARVVAGIGLYAFGLPLGVNTADGGLVPLQVGAVAVVNSASDVGRRRLTLAHELGHYLIADDYTVDWRIADLSGHVESLLDRFARIFLLPSAALERLWAKETGDYSIRDRAVLAGGSFHVDMSTLARRLLELELIDEQEANVVRAARTLKADIIEHGLREPLDLGGVSLPPSIELSVLAQYRRRRISAERAVLLLQGKYSFEDLPELPSGHPDEIWSILS